MKKLLVRVDDYPGTKPEEFYKHNLENFKKFHEVLRSRGIWYTLGVIPKYVTDEELEWLGNNQVDVSIHGIEHDERYLNEFRAHQTEQQITNLLDRVCFRFEEKYGEVDSYIPPHNVIDRKTCNALMENGLRCLYTGPGTDPEIARYALSIGMEVVNTEPPVHYGRSDELLTAGAHKNLAYLLSIGESPWLGLHWTWEQNIGLHHLEKFLDHVNEQCGIMEQTNGQG